MLYRMLGELRYLRPVGDPIMIQSTKLGQDAFGGMEPRFYQSGTAALAAALIANKTLLRDKTSNPEVILPAYACPDLLSACVFAGVTPVLVDLEASSCWLSLDNLTEAITNNTIGVIAVRFLGIAERMAQLKAICKQHDLLLIEDSAQGFPLQDAPDYWQGDINIVSFGRGKPVNMLGGGAAITHDAKIRANLPIPREDHKCNLQNKVRYYGKIRLYNLLIKPVVYGAATKLPGLNIGETIYKPLNNISTLPDCTKRYLAANIKAYRDRHPIGVDLHRKFDELNRTELVDLPGSSQHDFTQPLLRYPVLIQEQDLHKSLLEALRPLGASSMYGLPLPQIKGIPPGLIRTSDTFTNAQNLSQQLLTLPTHADVTQETRELIFRVIDNAWR